MQLTVKNAKQTSFNISYAGIHATYWMCFGALYSFSSVLLLSRNYTSSEIGLILALANLAAAFGQPFLADFADRRSKTTIFKTMITLNVVIAVLSILLIRFTERSVALSLSFLAVIAVMLLEQPFANALNRRLEETGITIRFGICRSAGSFFYAVLCLALGAIAESKGTHIIPYAELLAVTLFSAQIFITYTKYKRAIAASEAFELSGDADQRATRASDNAESSAMRGNEGAGRSPVLAGDEEIDLLTFIKTHKVFLILSLGTLGLYFSNTSINMYMAQIADNVGGNNEDVGRVFSILAFMEIPTLVLFDRLYKRFSSEAMLKFSSVGFVLWVGSCAIARSMGMLLGAQLFQMIAFALYMPTMVRFIDDNMKSGEAIKGQTLFTSVTTLAAVFAGLLGGRLIDVLGVNAMTMTATAFTIIGAIIVFLTVGKVRAAGEGSSRG